MRHRLDISLTAGGGHLWRLLDPFSQPIAESSTVAKDETTARANFDTAARAAGEVARAGRADPLAPTAALLARLATIIAHAEEVAFAELGPLDEIECDLPYLFGRASNEGHEAGQRLAGEVQAKMRAARLTSTTGAARVALAALLSDPTVVRWADGMRELSLMPAKRSQAAQEADPGTAPAGT